jgi:hypothetical protein
MSFAALLQDADTAVLGHLPGDEVVIYTPGAGAAVVVVGVYDAAYQKVDAGNAGVSDSAPAVFLRMEDLPSDPSDDVDARVTVDATVYRVREAQPDGQGMTLLFLQQVA